MYRSLPPWQDESSIPHPAPRSKPIYPTWNLDSTAGNTLTASVPTVASQRTPCLAVAEPNAGDDFSADHIQSTESLRPLSAAPHVQKPEPMASISGGVDRIPAQGNGRRMVALREELLTAWNAAIDEGAESGTYTLGKTVRQFEQMVEQAWATPGSDPLHAMMVNSGTAALYGALVGCGIKPGDVVIVPAMTFISTALACAWVGATPIFVDVTPGTWTLSLDAVRQFLVERADLRPRIRAIIPVHLYGTMMPEMAELADLAREEDWKVIEDASQAHGAQLRVGNETYFAGTLSHVGCFSMNGVKNAGVAEDGGCLLTRDPQMADFLRLWRDVGRKAGDRYGFHVPGVRGRMGTFNAACGMAQFRHLDKWNQQRREIAARYTKAINEAGSPLITPVVPDGIDPCWYKYVIVAGTPEERERIETCLQDAGVETEHSYPLALPDQPVYQSGQLPCAVAGDLVVARHLAACGTCLPIYPELTETEQQRVIEAVQEASNGLGSRIVPSALMWAAVEGRG